MQVTHECHGGKRHKKVSAGQASCSIAGYTIPKQVGEMMHLAAEHLAVMWSNAGLTCPPLLGGFRGRSTVVAAGR